MNSKRKKRLIKTGLFVVVLAVLIGAITVFLTSEAKKIARNRLIKQVGLVTDGLYNLDFGNLDINLLSGSVDLEDITLNLNQKRLSELYLVDSLPKFYGYLKIDKISLEGVDFIYRKKPQNRKLLFRRIDIAGPQITVIDNAQGIQSKHPKDTVVKVPNKTLYEMIAPYFELLSVSKIQLEDGIVHFYSEDRHDTTRVTLYNIHFQAEDFKIDSLSDKNLHCLYSKDFQLIIDSTAIHFPNHLYTLRSGKLEVALKDSLLKISDVAYVSKIPKWEFAYQDPKHSDWMDLRVGSIELKGLHIQRWMKEKRLFLDSLLVGKVYFRNYKNQKIPITHHQMPLIYEQVQRFPLPFSIQFVKVSDLNVFYEELAQKGTKPGLIKFTKMEGIFDGFTNIVSSPAQMNKLTATGKLMNKGLIRAELSFPVDSTNDQARITGTLGPMDMISLNSIIEPMVPVKIKSGFIQGLDFDIVGGKEKADIDMCLYYNDLSVDVGFLSLVANGLIERNNPKSGKEPRRVHVEHIRDPYHSSFNYLWKIYFAGIEETLGYTEKRQKRVTWAIKEYHALKKK
jgi:hypothetical protein